MTVLQRLLAMVSAGALMACGSAQTNKKAQVDPQPDPLEVASVQVATKADLQMALAEGRRILVQSLGIKDSGEELQSGSDEPATRTEIVKGLRHLVELAENEIKFTPVMVPYEASRLTIPAKDPARKDLERLIKWQFVAKLGPLAAGDKTSLTVAELGDAVGFCLTRIADVTHMPSTRWTPNLMGSDVPVQSGKERSSNGSNSE